MKKKNAAVQLKKVSEDDSRFLYELLAERDQKTYISMKKLPTYEEHIKFVKSRPYSKWYIIKFQNEKIGSISITKKNEIGIFIRKDMKRKGLGTHAMRLFLKTNPSSRYLANINPKNLESIKFFTNNGFKLIQHTYEFIQDKID